MADARRKRRVDAVTQRVATWAPEPFGETLADLGLSDAELAVVAKFAALLDDPGADQDEVALAARRAVSVMYPSDGLADHLARIEPT